MKPEELEQLVIRAYWLLMTLMPDSDVFCRYHALTYKWPHTMQTWKDDARPVVEKHEAEAKL